MKKMLICLLMALCLVPALLAEEAVESRMPVLMLEGNRTTGYDWSWEVDCEGIVGIVCEYVVDWQPENDADIMPPGVGGYCSITLTGLAAGETTITFTYGRPWEEKEPLYILAYHVCVDEELNVTILASSFHW